MIRINLSEEEVGILHNYARTSSIGLIRHKAHTVLLRSKAVLITNIAFTLNVGERTVGRWIKDFSEKRLSSIFSGLMGNENASKLTHAQKEEIKKALRTAKRVLGCAPA